MPNLQVRLRRREWRAATRGGPHALGIVGERVAERVLKKQGLRLLGRNASIGGVEVDLVFLTKNNLAVAIVEVKTRHVASAAGGRFPGEAAVNPVKVRRLQRAGRAATRALRAPADAFQIDVVVVECLGDRSAQVRWFQDCAPR